MFESEENLSLFTIGHSNHSLETFLGLLRQNRIEVLIDTRSAPFSRFSPHFNRDDLKRSVEEEGMKYGFYGKELGGRPQDEDFYDEAGHVLYSQVAKSWLFNEGIERLMKGIAKYRVAIFCSEEDPSVCHRRLLVSRVLFQQGVTVFHIRGDGTIVTEQELQLQEEAQNGDKQPTLFDEEGKSGEWKSIQSVLHKVRQHTSLAD